MNGEEKSLSPEEIADVMGAEITGPPPAVRQFMSLMSFMGFQRVHPEKDSDMGIREKVEEEKL